MISLSDLHPLFMRVEYPGRYVGGEFGSGNRFDSGAFRVALCFPDLYEIGMSNYALRLLYKMANDTPGVFCERVFAPAPDFKAALSESGIPLFTLETRTPLHQVDLIAVTIGYELAATTLVGLLESGWVDPVAERRKAPGPRTRRHGPPFSTASSLKKPKRSFHGFLPPSRRSSVGRAKTAQAPERRRCPC